MYCNYCGKVIQDDANLCAYCGKRVAYSVARRRLVRPRANRSLAGVCAGLAEYFDLDVSMIRLGWAIAVIFAGCGILAYLLAWLVIPNEPYFMTAPPPVPDQQSVRNSA